MLLGFKLGRWCCCFSKQMFNGSELVLVRLLQIPARWLLNFFLRCLLDVGCDSKMVTGEMFVQFPSHQVFKVMKRPRKIENADIDVSGLISVKESCF